MKDYEELYRKDKPRAINQFTRDLEERMKQQLLIIEPKENDEVVGQLEELLFAQRSAEKGMDVTNPVQAHLVSVEIADKMKTLYTASPEKCSTYREEVKKYFSELKKRKLRDWVLDEYDHRKLTAAKLLFYILFFITGFPFYVFGVLTNYVPYKLPWILTKKIVKEVEWSATVNGTIGVIFWQIWWLLQSLVVALVFRNWYILGAFMILVPLCGIHAQAYWVYLKRFSGSMRWWMTNANDKKMLLGLRGNILKKYSELN